jgi:hypothetical protein
VAETGPRLAHVTGEARLSSTDCLPSRLFPKFENNVEAGFSRVKVYVFASRLPLGKSPTLILEKLHLKSFSDFGKKIYKTKLALPNNFSLGPKETWEVFDGF